MSYTEVREIKDAVVDQVDTIFTQLKTYAQDSFNAADAIVVDDTSLTAHSVNVDEPPQPNPDQTWEEILAKLDSYRDRFLTFPAFPAAPTETLVDPIVDTTPPDLIEPTFPVAPTIENIQFTATFDGGDLVFNIPGFSFNDVEYVSSLATALYNALNTDIANGGYGLDTDDEDRLFERARDREMRSYSSAAESALRLFSASGFAMPTGAAQAAVQRAHTEAMTKIGDLNRELAIKKADLYSEHKKHTLTTASQVENSLMQNHAARMDRLLKSAVEQITVAIAEAALYVQRFQAFVQLYEADAKVFESRLRGESLKVEIYGKQIDAERAKIDANRSLIDAFIAKNKAVIDAFLGKVEGYKARLDAYSKIVGAIADRYKAEAEAFAAAIGGLRGAVEHSSNVFSGDVRWQEAKLVSRTQEAQLKLTKAVEIARNEIEGEKAKLASLATMATGAMSALNVQASLHASGGASISGDVNESTNHNYYHTVS